MTLNLIDQEIIDIFFKFYKKDFKKADEDLQKNLNKKIAENIAKIENDEDSKIMILQTFSDYSFSFFHVVAKFGISEDLKKIIYLIGLKNLEQVDINKYTALHHASISGNIENVKVLIGYGANIYAKSSDETRNWLPIHYACKFGFKNIVEEFINSGIDKEVKTSFGLTPIHIACEFGYPDLVKYLVQIGCDTNCETSSENHRLTPLHYAIIINSSDTVDVLFKAGADIHKKNIYGDNALILATKRNYSKIRKLKKIT
jgi:ankyrin repeat protein